MEEAEAMFRDAGFEEMRHFIQQRHRGTPRAITTVATVPDGDDTAPSGGVAEAADEAAASDD